MTPGEFEWAQEQLEQAYLNGDIGKLTFLRRMAKLGFKDVDKMRELLSELDARAAN